MYYVRGHIFLFLALLPIAHAQWLVYVSASPGVASFTGYAAKSGCIYVVSGTPVDLRYYTASAVYDYNNVGRYICLPAETFFTLDVRGSDVYVKFPYALVHSDANPFVVIHSEQLSDVTFVHVYTNYVLIIATIIVFLILLLVLMLKRRRKREEGPVDAVIEYIASHPGCTQKQISEALGMKKYQITRILKKLEQRGVIIRIRRGISKRVYLKEQLQ